jgi:hypothetical protein
MACRGASQLMSGDESLLPMLTCSFTETSGGRASGLPVLFKSLIILQVC